MTTNDTRAAIESAIDALIDAEDIDTRAVVAAEAGDKAAIDAIWTTEPIALMRRTELRAAITAHVAAEVAWALACAPGVEEAIGDMLGQVGCAAHHRETMADTLRAAIAADKARAVDEVRAAVVGEAADRIVDAIAAEAARSLVAPAVAEAARAALLRALGVEA